MTTKKLTDYIKQQASPQSGSKIEQVEPAHARIRFKKETEFQETPIGKIPKEWRIGVLHDLGELVEGFAFPPYYQGKRGLNYLFIKVSDTNIRGNEKYIRISENTIDDDMAYRLGVEIYPPGTIIFPKIGEVIKLRKVRILARHGTFDNNIIGIIPSEEKVNGEFLYYYILGRVDFTRLIGGSTAPALRKSDIAKIKIALPPSREQVEIARILSFVDHVIEKVRLLVERAERLKKGLMQELLTKGIGHKEYKETPIGKIPKEWKIVRLVEVAEVRKNKLINNVDKVSFIPMELVPENGLYAKFEIRDFSEVKSYVYCERGDILLAKVTPCFENGKQAIVPNNIPTKYVLATTEVYPIVAKHIDRVFLFYVLKYEKYRKPLEASMKGTTGRRRVSKDALENLLIPLPSVEEQKRIAETLLSVDNYIEALERRLERLERVKKGLMEVLLTGKVRVVAEPS